jgi:uncharacterized phage protein gp47/JayE
MAGLSSTGFEAKRLPEVLDDIETSERANIDSNISSEDDEVLGQLNNTYGTPLATLWAQLEAVYDNFNLDKAEGKNLDDLAAITGITRIAAAASNTDSQRFTGDDGTLIPLGSLLQSNINTNRFQTIAAINLDSTVCFAVNLSIPVVSDTTLYGFSVNSTVYSFLSDGSATESEILVGLKADVDADGLATWTATINGSQLLIQSDSANIQVDTLVLVAIDDVTAVGSVQASVTGTIVAVAGTVTVIVNALSGFNSTTNTDTYNVGRDRETDEELRARTKISQQASGGATVPALEDALNNTTGVTSARIIENRTLVTDGDGRPGKSFESVVVGGTDADVAQTIWDSKALGIETFGNTAESVDDSQGFPQTINFTRPLAVNLAFRVTYSLYDEEVFPTDGETVMVSTVVDYTTDQGVDVDVIPSRYFGPIYSDVSGIDTLVVEVQQITNPGDAPLGGSWQTTKLDIDFDQFGATTNIDIEIVSV